MIASDTQIFHVVALDDWLAVPDQPYAPPSLSEDGFVHCSPDEAVTLAVANSFYRDTPGPLMVLLIDEHKLDVMVGWEAASPVPPPPALCSRTSTGASTATRWRECWRSNGTQMAVPWGSRCGHEDRGLDHEMPDFS